jgi:hypothetical protein
MSDLVLRYIREVCATVRLHSSDSLFCPKTDRTSLGSARLMRYVAPEADAIEISNEYEFATFVRRSYPINDTVTLCAADDSACALFCKRLVSMVGVEDATSFIREEDMCEFSDQFSASKADTDMTIRQKFESCARRITNSLLDSAKHDVSLASNATDRNVCCGLALDTIDEEAIGEVNFGKTDVSNQPLSELEEAHQITRDARDGDGVN